MRPESPTDVVGTLAAVVESAEHYPTPDDPAALPEIARWIAPGEAFRFLDRIRSQDHVGRYSAIRADAACT